MTGRDETHYFGDGCGIDHGEQPAPIPNDQPSIQGMVRADLEQREQVGIQRYGTPLQAHNGRDALRDAYEEALDLACYLRQAIAERDSLTIQAYLGPPLTEAEVERIKARFLQAITPPPDGAR